MKLVREPEPLLDVEAVRARLRLATREPLTETALDALVDIPGLIAEIGQLLRVEESTRREFAELLAATRAVLPTLVDDHSEPAMTLCVVVGLHREITPEELDQWSDAGATEGRH